jgi:translation initiation factor IF-3
MGINCKEFKLLKELKNSKKKNKKIWYKDTEFRSDTDQTDGET